MWLVHLRLEQKGLIAYRQLGKAGVSRGRLRWLLQSGRWQTVLPRVYAMFTGTLLPEQRFVAAQLYGGDGAMLTGGAALTVHGFRQVPKDPAVRLLVPDGRRLRSTGFVKVHTTGRPDTRAWANGVLRPTSPARSVIEAGRHCSDRRRIRAMVAESVQEGLCRPDDLVSELAAAPRAGTAGLRVAVAEVVAGVRSVAEGEARLLFARSKVLPALVWNPRLVSPDGAVLPSPDGWLAEVDVAVEVDSRAYHLSPEDWERTMWRHAQLTQFGVLVVHVSPRRIREDGAGVVELLETAYRQRRGSGYRSRIRMVQ